MSYNSFCQSMRAVAREAELSQFRLAPEYQRLVEILDANPDPGQAERALMAEYWATGKDFFQNKVWEVRSSSK